MFRIKRPYKPPRDSRMAGIAHRQHWIRGFVSLERG
jgi:hypothetical protein